MVVVLVVTFTGSFLASWAMRPSEPAVAQDVPPPAPGLNSSPTGRAVADPHPAPPDAGPDRLERADRYLREHKHAAALGIYKQLAAEAATGPLYYRIGCCQEALGNADKAAAAYRRAVSDAAFVRGHPAAQVALARVLTRLGQFEEARHLLYPLVLAADPAAVAPAVLAEARYGLVLALAREAMPPVAAETLAGQLAVPDHDSAEPPTDPRELAEPAKAPAKAPAAPGGAAHVLEPLVIRPGSGGAEPLVVRAVFPTQAADELFDLLASTAGVRLEWTAAARDAVRDRHLRLKLQDWPLIDLFEVLADAVGLVGQADAAMVRLATAGEAAAEARQHFRADLARRALRRARLSSPEHRLAPAASLLVGNVEAAVGQPEAAAAQYAKMLSNHPFAPLAVHANFNLALVDADRGKYGAARKALYRAIDLSPGHVLAPSAHLHLGRMYLEEGDVKRAVAELRRARAKAAGTAVQPLVALTLAAAHLTAGEPRPAREALAEQRGPLRQETYRKTAALLDALARYRIARPHGPARVEAADLVAALAQPRDVNPLGAVETDLRCKAQRELGLWDEVVATCDQALPSLRGPLVPAIRVAQGEALLRLDRRAEAVACLGKVADQKGGKWSAEALLLLAGLDLYEGRAADCAARCARIWRSEAGVDPTAVLRLWGAAYEQLGEYAKAARCFAGTPPE